MGEHVAVLVNPAAGRGRGRRVADRAVRQLRDHSSADVRVLTGTSAPDLQRLARAALAAGPSRMVVVGGDGTLSCLLEVLAGSGTPVALVPAGTGDDFARALGIPRDPEAAAALALTGSVRPVDLGVIESPSGTRFFATVAAMGIDAKVAVRTNALRRPRGRARYYVALAIEVARLAPISFRVGVDGGDPLPWPGTLIAIGNTAGFGGGLRVCPLADPQDGLLDISHAGPLTRRRLVPLFLRLMRGRHLGRPGVTALRAGRVRVDAPGMVVIADGEQVASGPAEFTVRPGALLVATPPGCPFWSRAAE